jgi:Trk K+ transport system NAD-binding subunit
LAERYHLAENMRRLTIPADSILVGQTLEMARFRRDYQVTVLKIMRPSDHVRLADLGHNIDTRRPRDTPIVPTAQTTRVAGDHLIVEGRLGNIERAADTFAHVVEPPKPKDINALVSLDIGVAEVIIRQRSRLIGKTLATSNFGDVFKLTVLEVRRPPNIAPLHRDTTLRFGDVLLVQG